MYQIEFLNQQLRSEFEVKDLRPAKKILGVKLIRNRKKGTLLFTQQKYNHKVLEKFEMLKTKLVQTPLAAYFLLLCQ